MTISYGNLDALVGTTINATSFSDVSGISSKVVSSWLGQSPQYFTSLTTSLATFNMSLLQSATITAVDDSRNLVTIQLNQAGFPAVSQQLYALATSGNMILLDNDYMQAEAGNLAENSFTHLNGGGAWAVALDGSNLRTAASSTVINWTGLYPASLTAAQAVNEYNALGFNFPQGVLVADSAANVSANLSALTNLATDLGGIVFTDAGTPTLNLPRSYYNMAMLNLIQSPANIHVTNALVSDIQYGSFNSSIPTSATISDTAAHIQTGLDLLETNFAAGKVTGVNATDPGIPTIHLSTAQLTADAPVLTAIGGTVIFDATPSGSSSTVNGISGRATILELTGNASAYSFTAKGDGFHFTVSGNGTSDQISNVTELKFGDFSDFVASQTPQTAGGVSSAQIADLYSAVFARAPDAAGLAYYENQAAANPTLPITLYAQQFLSSPEYTGNSAHNYAQTSVGDAQFITDTYNNLLHRGPASGDVAWYQANVIQPFLNGLTPGSSAYASAELQAHAAILADFSQSTEFLGNVQVTAQHPSDAQHWLILI